MEDTVSGAVRAIHYDEERQRLVIRFEDGGEYAFVGVPGEVTRSFAESPSKADFFDDQISGHYPYNKLS